MLRIHERDCTVNIGGMDGIANNGLRRAWIDLHIAPSDGFEYCSSIERRLIERSISVYGADAQKFHARILRA